MFSFSIVALCQCGYYKMTKWPYLSPQAQNPKSKGTLLSSTSKVEESNVPWFYFIFKLRADILPFSHIASLPYFHNIGKIGLKRTHRGISWVFIRIIWSIILSTCNILNFDSRGVTSWKLAYTFFWGTRSVPY